mgnify:CR=1 FL=1
MKCFIAIDEDLLLKLWMLDPQLVTPFSRVDLTKQRDAHLARRTSRTQLRECHVTIDVETQTELPMPENIGCLP